MRFRAHKLLLLTVPLGDSGANRRGEQGLVGFFHFSAEKKPWVTHGSSLFSLGLPELTGYPRGG